MGLPKDKLIEIVEIVGQLSLHEMTTSVEKPLRQTLVKLLADLYGKDVSDIVRIAHDAEITFALKDGRLHYDGLAIGFPSLLSACPDLLLPSLQRGLSRSLGRHI